LSTKGLGEHRVVQYYGFYYIIVVLPGAGEECPTARWGGKSGQLKDRVAEETRFFSR